MDQLTEVSLYRPKPTDLVAFLPFACSQLEAPFQLRVLVENVAVEADDKGKKSKRDKTPQSQPSYSRYSVEKQVSVVKQDYGDQDEVVLRARCDSLGRAVELLFHRCTQIPRLLMKLIGLCIPYNEQLVKITIRWGPLDGYLLYEIAKFLPLSQITEICLDDSPVSHYNYYLLLERRTLLRTLSLARCGLADEECAALAAQLANPQPASRSLTCLSLESNRIGDEGARALSDALRTNRSLRHLNLAGNAITSLGAAHLFRSLVRFQLSNNELIQKRRRTFEYLKLRNETYARCCRELTLSERGVEGRRARSRVTGVRSRRASTVSVKGSGVDSLASRAEAMAAELIDAPVDLFDSGELETHGDTTFCAGNFTLNYLNLAYNELDCTSVRRLAAVLAYQAEGARRTGAGLLRVVLEGNPLPAASAGARSVAYLLQSALAGTAGVPLKPNRRKSERYKVK